MYHRVSIVQEKVFSLYIIFFKILEITQQPQSTGETAGVQMWDLIGEKQKMIKFETKFEKVSPLHFQHICASRFISNISLKR